MKNIEYNTIKSMWKDLCNAIFTQKVSRAQYEDMKGCFYAGATAVLSIMGKMADDDVPIEAGATVYENLRQEVISFGSSEIEKIIK